MAVELQERVINLEDILARFISRTDKAFLRLERSQRRADKRMRAFQDEMKDFKDEMKDFKDEMKDFKDEMKDFKDEMKDFKDEMKDFKDGMKDFKDEMKDFKDGMDDYKEEMRAEKIRMNKIWGDLANKTGKMVEDLVFPSIGRIIREQYQVEAEDIMARYTRKLKDGRRKEFDLIAVVGEKLFLNSTKSSLYKRDVDELIEDIPIFREFFPEYKDKKVIGILASLAVDVSVLKYAEKKGFWVLAVGEEIMEVQNNPEFKAKEW